MKKQIKKSELKDRSDIWNAVIFEITSHDFPAEEALLNECNLVFQYYSEIESGGHEILLNWTQQYIREVGIAHYLSELTAALEKIGATDYAQIEKTYGEKLWRLFTALENEEIEEEAFYEVIEKADEEYYALNGKLEQLLESYFVDIHMELFEVI
ncbi:hypothetical protein QWY15_07245 [Planococcus sp. N064]|uniref:DNA mimic protein DMP19 C-terminal domain-containing protein n=1 Tax=Planococcus liqunii TaxID=3058394 RepID=A0ABT8MQC7_9BACL|nr:hypothetical protein [Planococcus sp. N064]MDN7227093.1 hypothetical protein [Planococcus sp. N064]